MVYARADGAILDHPELLAAGVGGGAPRPARPDELVPLPRGSDLFLLPRRRPIGIDARTGEPDIWDGDGQDAFAVAAFLAPAWTVFLHAAYRSLPGAPVLPLFAYGAVGFADGRFWATGARVDRDPRQDPWRFDLRRIERGVDERGRAMPSNLVVQTLGRCALDYHCRAAQNYFLGRHEAPIPTSIACNSCLGCISLQPDGTFPASHERLRRAPSAQEIADVAIDHLRRVPDGVVSFGQGCEGEPLLHRELLPESVRRIRQGTGRGTINLNTNGSLPEVVDGMCRAGLDSIRVSINSVRRPLYDAYYRPRGYGLQDVAETLRVVRRHDRYRSINCLVFPGVTDTEEELDALSEFIEETDLDLVQMRNLNVDPEVYRQGLPAGSVREGMGLGTFMRQIQKRFPHLRFGYFNPSKETYATYRAARSRPSSAAGGGAF
jgi:pyruvate-formate lyase-activating enzyme